MFRVCWVYGAMHGSSTYNDFASAFAGYRAAANCFDSVVLYKGSEIIGQVR
jgi:hypothetical protein